MWKAVLFDNGERHVIPLNDLRQHFGDDECWCKPQDREGILVHNSADGREKHETN